MIIISNHVMKKMTVPSDAVIRVNLAWIKSVQEAEDLLTKLSLQQYDIYLDYPQGRSKPPVPTINQNEAILLAAKYHVKFFAVSNAEDANEVYKITKHLPIETEFVPKIETKKGIGRFEAIIRTANTKHAMLDKEDLWTDVSRDSIVFDALIDLTRRKAKDLNVELLELQGVVFA